MDAPLAPHLPRFSSAPPPVAFGDEMPSALPEPDFDAECEVDIEPQPSMISVDHDARLLEACEAVRHELEAENAAALDAAEKRHGEALASAVAAAEAVRDAEHGAAIAVQIAAAIEAMHEALATDLARALRPLLSEAVVARAVAAAADIVARAVADPTKPGLTVCGPLSLLTAIEAGLTGVAGIEFTATEGDEVTVNCNSIHIETRLAQALTSLAEGGV